MSERYNPAVSSWRAFIRNGDSFYNLAESKRIISVLASALRPLGGKLVVGLPNDLNGLRKPGVRFTNPVIENPIEDRGHPLIIDEHIEDMLSLGYCARGKMSAMSTTTPYLRGVGNEIYCLVGDFGEDSAKRVVAAAVALDNYVYDHQKEFQVEHEYDDLMRDESILVNGDAIFREGIQTLAGLIGMLSYNQAKNFKNIDDFVEQLHINGIFNQIALAASNGGIFPKVKESVYYVDPLNISAGKVSLSPKMKEALKYEKKVLATFRRPGFRAAGCPFAYRNVWFKRDKSVVSVPKTGIDDLTETFIKVLREV